MRRSHVLRKHYLAETHLVRFTQRQPTASGPGRSTGLTLVELLVGIWILVISIVPLLTAFVGQATVNEHARNLTWAMNDATRVMERLRELNVGCATPTALATALPVAECGGVACASWDAWLAAATGGGGKSIQPTPAVNELVVLNPPVGTDPLQVSVAVCWRHRSRPFGGCAWNGAGFNPPAAAITSPAILTTSITCRG